MRSLNIAATGLTAQQLNVDTISHNLANMTTTSFKAHRPEFQDLMYQDIKRVGVNSTDQGTILPVGVQIGLGVKTGAVSRDMGQGTFENTENAMDVAINGKGFFQVELPDGTTAYTRDGGFKISEDGTIVNRDGFTIQPAITIPDNAESVSINTSGEVSVIITGQTDSQQLGQFEIASFINPVGLQETGDNLYLETTASGNPLLNNAGQDGMGTIMQGYLENSNVNAVSEITDLIVAQRAYEMNTKVLSASDEMLQNLNQSV